MRGESVPVQLPGVSGGHSHQQDTLAGEEDYSDDNNDSDDNDPLADSTL